MNGANTILRIFEDKKPSGSTFCIVLTQNPSQLLFNVSGKFPGVILGLWMQHWSVQSLDLLPEACVCD